LNENIDFLRKNFARFYRTVCGVRMLQAPGKFCSLCKYMTHMTKSHFTLYLNELSRRVKCLIAVIFCFHQNKCNFLTVKSGSVRWRKMRAISRERFNYSDKSARAFLKWAISLLACCVSRSPATPTCQRFEHAFL